MFRTIFNISKVSTKDLFRPRILINKSGIMTTCKIQYNFTSSSNPSQVALMQQVQGKVFQVLRSAAKCDQKKLNRNSTFEQLGFDSLDAVELVVAMQEYFGFDIPNEQAEKIQTVQSAINTFFRHLNSQVANKVVQKNQTDSNLEGKK